MVRNVACLSFWYLFFASVGVPALDAATIDDLTWDSSGQTVIITDCDPAAAGDLVIPETIDGKLVGSIGFGAFRDCSSLTSVTIPNGVTSIGSFAFLGCSSLEAIQVHEDNLHYSSVSGVLYDKLRTILLTCPTKTNGDFSVPGTVSTIVDRAFADCSSLTSVSIPDGVTSIGSSAFSGCSGLTSMTIPSGVTSIEERVFVSCSGLTGVTIPDGVTSIGEVAFGDCSSLTSVTIPDSVTLIERSAFTRCSSLTSVSMSGSLTEIGNSVFKDCNSLTNVTIPDGVMFIWTSAFSGCSSLTSVAIPDTLTRISASAFSGCTSLTNVIIPDGVTIMSDRVFEGCSSLKSITLPSGVTTISSSLFEGCSSLKSITIPSGVTTIRDSVFAGCASLSSVVLDGDAPVSGDDVFNGVHADAAVFVRAGAQGFGVEFGGLPVVVIVDLIDRLIFYNDSILDETNDADAIATDKSALLPGQQVTFANYTSYSNGINGVMVDLSAIPDPNGIGTDDLVFRVGNSQDLTAWVAAPAPLSIEVEVGGGDGGSDRIKIIWANNAIEKQWLEVTVLSNADTGLIEDDVFYFGNAIGDTGNDPDGTAVNISDENGARQNPRNFLDPAPIDDPYDFNRDGFVNISDENIARQNGTNFLTELAMLDLTGVSPAGDGLSRASVSGVAGLGAVNDRVSIRRTNRDGEFLIEARLPEGRVFELQYRDSVMLVSGLWLVMSLWEGEMR